MRLLLKGTALLLALALTGCISGTVNTVGVSYTQGEQEADADTWWNGTGAAYFKWDEIGAREIRLCSALRWGWDDIVEDKRTWRNVSPSLCTAFPLGQGRR